MNVSGPFMSLKQAAEYCGYHPDTFSRKLKEYQVPRHGPEKNRFAKTVLDAFMENPHAFAKVQGHQRKRKPKGVIVMGETP